MRTRDRHTTRTAAVALFAVAGLGLAGCGEEEAGPEVEDIEEGEVLESSPPPEATEDASVLPGAPYRGAYNQEFYDDQEIYEGQEVTLSAEVEGIVSANALEISDPNNIDLEPLLVLHDLEAPDLEEGQVVEVVGTVQEGFTLATAEEDLGVDLVDELFTDYEEEPYLQASDVSTDVPQE